MKMKGSNMSLNLAFRKLNRTSHNEIHFSLVFVDIGLVVKNCKVLINEKALQIPRSLILQNDSFSSEIVKKAIEISNRIPEDLVVEIYDGKSEKKLNEYRS